MCYLRKKGRCRSGKYFLEGCSIFRTFRCEVAVKGLMTGRIMIALVIGLVVAGIIFFAETAFSERGYADRGTVSRTDHTYAWERTVCFKCHSSSEGSMTDHQVRIAAFLTR